MTAEPRSSGTYTNPRTHIAVDLAGAALPLICLWPSGETTIATIHELCRDIRDRAQVDGAIPEAVYIRQGGELVKVHLDVHEEAIAGQVAVKVTRPASGDGRPDEAVVARGWYHC
jgi:hypothetical protein